MERSTAREVARYVALGALFAVPLMPLIVANTYFFPFITGKGFFFRIMVEIAVAAWAVLALLDREYRPRRSLIGILAAAFVLWMFVADSFAPNAAKAFWSNFERMEGWVLLAHLLGFFVAASAVLRAEKKWRTWFLTSLAVSLVVTGYALLQLSGALAIHQGSTRIDATFGNSAYLAIYFLFNFFIAGWLALTEERPWLKYSLGALAVIEGVLIFFTETRGTIIGLTLGVLAAAALTMVTAGHRARRAAAWLFALILIVAGTFYLARDSAFVQNNHILQRIASISLADGSTRFTIWGMAYEGFKERPLIGWGQEGFNYVFNKYYDPSLYRQEAWFDRAHNAFIDWLSAGGLPAFLLYIGLFVSALWLLWRRSELSRPERTLLTGALIGYAVHNLFVFDNLYSYVYFFAILALIDSQVAAPVKRIDEAPEMQADAATTYALPIAAIVAIALIWTVNVPGMRAANELVLAISPSAEGAGKNLALFRGLTEHPSFAGQEIREQLVSFAGDLVQTRQASTEMKQQALALAISEMQKQVAAYPNDARERLQLAYAYRAAGQGQAALEQVEAAVALSPKKQQMWIEAGAAAWDSGDVALAEKDFNTAYELAPQFTELAAYAAAGDIAAGDRAKADATLLKAYGTTTVDSDILAVAYYRTKYWPRLIELWKLRASAPDAGPQPWFSLAAAYYASGDKANAIATVREAMKRFPEAAAAGAAAITEIQGAPAQ